MAYYFAMGAVLFSAFIGYIEDYRITYDELIVAVCDAINFFGLAYICQSAASRFGSGDRFAQGSNPRANSAGKGNSDDINKILAVLGDLDELYSHLRAAWMLNAILRLVKITKAGGEQGARHVVSAVAIVSSIALLDRVMGECLGASPSSRRLCARRLTFHFTCGVK